MKVYEIIQDAWNELLAIKLEGPIQWEHGLRVSKDLLEIKQKLMEEEKIRESAYNAALKDEKVKFQESEDV